MSGLTGAPPWLSAVSAWLLWPGPSGAGSGQPRGGPEGGSLEARTASDRLTSPSWIIGAAVVNAFYSPNRNQIGTPRPHRPWSLGRQR